MTNRRTDEWGGDLEGRRRFLEAVCRAARQQGDPDYPLFVKLGLVDGVEGGLTLEEGVQVVAALEDMGLDAVEISGGIGVGGLRSRQVMEDVLAAGDADMISLGRPLICEPDLSQRLCRGQERSRCISANRCWVEGPGEGIACKCPLD